MALQTEILNLLEHEQLDTSLGIAGNVFKSNEVPIRQKEMFLLKWISEKIDVQNDPAIWNLLDDWLHSEQLRSLNRYDILLDNLHIFAKSLGRNLHRINPGKELTHRLVTAVVDNPVFLQHFRYDLELYCQFIVDAMSSIRDETLLAQFLQNDNLFNKSVTQQKNFVRIFSVVNLPHFVQILASFKQPETLFHCFSKLVQRCLFEGNLTYFSAVLTHTFQSDSKAPDGTLIKSIFVQITDNIDVWCKLLLDAFCKAYGTTSFVSVYQFVVLIFKCIGFDLAQSFPCPNIPKFIQKTEVKCSKLKLITSVYGVIGNNKIDLTCVLNDVSFSDFLKNIVLSIMAAYRTPSEDVLAIFRNTLTINSMIIEALTNELLQYLVFTAHEDSCQNDYEHVFIELIDIYSRLHRIPNFVHKLLSIHLNVNIQAPYKLFGRNEMDEAPVSDKYNCTSSLSMPITERFGLEIVGLVRSQVLNVFMTVYFKLDECVNNIVEIVDDPIEVAMLEMRALIFCEFLNNVKFSEYTTSDVILEKFLAVLTKTHSTLTRFGEALLQIEHKRVLMNCFLRCGIVWSDVYMTLRYYTSHYNSDATKFTCIAACGSVNMSYLHSYLPVEKWTLISERITNFGEVPCKQLQYKMALQTIKAAHLFVPNFNADDPAIDSILGDILPNIDHNWLLIVSDPLEFQTVIPKVSHINGIDSAANALLNELLEHQINTDCFNYALNSNAQFSKHLLYLLLQRINKLLRSKRKHADDDGIQKPTSTTMFKLFNASFADIEEISVADIFVRSFENREEFGNVNVDVEVLHRYLAVLKQFPILFYEKSVQNLLFLYLSALLHDLKGFENKQQKSLTTTLEAMLISMVKNTSLPIVTHIPIVILIRFVEDSFLNPTDMFTLIAETFCKNPDYINRFKPALKLVAKNMSSNRWHNEFAVIIINVLYKCKQMKLTTEHKSAIDDFRTKFIEKIVKLVQENTEDVELFFVALNNAIASDIQSQIDILTTHIEHYYAVANRDIMAKGSLDLILLILKHKTHCQVFYKTNTNIYQETWKSCGHLKNLRDEQIAVVSKIVILIFEHTPNDDFNDMLQEFLSSMRTALKTASDENVENELNRWIWLLASSFNADKTKLWAKAIEALLTILIRYDTHTVIVTFIKAMISTNQVQINGNCMDLILHVIRRNSLPSRLTLSSLLIRHRKFMVLDRLPSFLDIYRSMLSAICQEIDSEKVERAHEFDQHAHQLSKLTDQLVECGKHMARLSPYVIADFVRQWEQSSPTPSIKMHLSNCVYALLTLCDKHAIAFLMRMLSVGGTEIFKAMYDTYKKYYKFTGKV